MACGGCFLRRLLVVTILLPTLSGAPTQEFLQNPAQGTQDSLQRTALGTQDSLQRTAQGPQDSLPRTAQGIQGSLKRTVQGTHDFLQRTVQRTHDFLQKTSQGVQDFLQRAAMQGDTSRAVPAINSALHKEVEEPTINTAAKGNDYDNSASGPDDLAEQSRNLFLKDTILSEVDVGPALKQFVPDTQNSTRQPDVSQNSISQPDVSQRLTNSASTLENPKRLTNLFIQPNVPPGQKNSISQPDESQRHNVEQFSEERLGEPKNEYDRDLLNGTPKTSVPDMQININYSEGRNTIKNSLHVSAINISQSTVNNYYAKENTKSESEVLIELSPQVDEHNQDILPRIVGSSASAGGVSSSRPVGIAIQPVKPREIFSPSQHAIHPPSPQIVTSSPPVNQRDIHSPAPVEFPASPQPRIINKPANQREFRPLGPAEYAASPSEDSFPQAVPQKQIIQVYTTPSPFFTGFTQPPPSQVPKFQPSISQQHQGSNLPSEQQILYNEPQSPSHPQKQFARKELYSPQGPAVTSGYSKLTSTPIHANEPPKNAQNQFSGYAKVSEKYDSSANMFPQTEYQPPHPFGEPQPQYSPQYSHEKNYPVTPDPYNPLSGYVIPNESDDSWKYLSPNSGYQLPNPQHHNSPEANYPAETYTRQSLKYLSEETPKYGNEPYTKHYNSLTPADAPKESFGNINGQYVIASNSLYPNSINGPNPEHSGHGGKYTPQNEVPQYLHTASGQTVSYLNPYTHQYELARLETQANSYQKVEHQLNPYQKTDMNRHYYRLSSHSKNPLGKASYIVQQPSEATFSIIDAFHFSPDFLETVYIRGESVKEVSQLNEREDYDIAKCNPCNRNYNPASYRFTDWQWRTSKCSGVAICSNNTVVSTGPNRCVRGGRDYTACNPCGRTLKRATFKKKGASISPSVMSYEDIRIRGLTFYDDNANVYQFSDESESSRSWDTSCGSQLPEGTDDHEKYRYYY